MFLFRCPLPSRDAVQLTENDCADKQADGDTGERGKALREKERKRKTICDETGEEIQVGRVTQRTPARAKY